MEKRQIFIGIGICGLVLIMLLIILFNSDFLSQKTKISEEGLANIKEAEISLEKNGIKNIAGVYPKYEKIEVGYYYREDDCFGIFKAAIKKFNGLINLKDSNKLKKIDKNLLEKLNLRENGVSMPVAVLSGSAEVYDYGNNYIKSELLFKSFIYGISACSEKILTYNLCSILKNPPEFCDKISIQEENIEAEKLTPPDFVCYDNCNIKYSDGNRLFAQIWQGPPCNRIKGYVEGESKIRSKECHGNSCRSDANDLGCCKSTECIENGKCHPISATKDIDADGQIELCANINNTGIWINPDLNLETCLDAAFKWFNCLNESECKYGINNYYKKNNGLCCGDDKGEQVSRCKGKLCKSDEDIACCKANSCVFNGNCYENGCTQFEIGSEDKISAFCDGNTNTWIDLDNNYCVQCLGKKAWSGTICCGDDANEGKYPIKFVANNKNGTSEVLYYGCANKKTDCVYPYSETSFNEGFYVFKENSQYIKGGYYCENNQWYSLDNSKKYCKESGFNWDTKIGICCGDNSNEFYIKGSDGTSSCCILPSDNVINGICQPTTLCGNNILDSGELCEQPNTENNTYCQQSQQQCLGNKLGIRNQQGYCNANCQCQGDEFSYSCAGGSCGAECGNDNDCGQGNKCDLNSCSCKPKTYCGDNIVQSYNDFAQKEECELPNSINNTNCKIEQCKDKKSIFVSIKTDYDYRLCNNNCQCDYGEISYACKKNFCGAECNEDGTGCGESMQCNTDTCICSPLPVVCGNGICEQNEEASCPSDCKISECPYRIDLKLDKNSYYLNDTINAEVTAYDKNNNPLSEVKFDLDILVNDVLIGSSTYSTTSAGYYIIKKKVSNFAPKGVHKYIAKTKEAQCEIVSDTEMAYIYVNNPYTIPPQKINYSRFEFIIDKFDVTNERVASKCGDNIIGYGEACEGNNVCRKSVECDYKNRIYDFVEYCSSCNCQNDEKSEPSDEGYCSSCQSCGDGAVNCNEECENETINVGPICRFGKLYDRIDACSNCKWYDDSITSDVLIDSCDCKCPKNPEVNCINGNYINYTQDYNAGCSDGKCNSCNCIDTYAKDSNNDSVEDKCNRELCGNKIDDNDNGLIDEESCIWHYCSQCGYGLFNSCTRKECSKFQQGCFFNKFEYKIFNYTLGTCSTCSSLKSCEEYKSDNITCIADPCKIGNCAFDGKQCCIDNDNDDICDSADNCLNLSNPKQENSDKDDKGDACEICINEPLLVEPAEQKEVSCDDGIDNDCDGLADCKDSDCTGISNCCQTSNDCEQSNCTIEKCVDNRCDYKIRPLCDNRECPKGSYCDVDGKCKEPDSSSNVCSYCVDNCIK